MNRLFKVRLSWAGFFCASIIFLFSSTTANATSVSNNHAWLYWSNPTGDLLQGAAPWLWNYTFGYNKDSDGNMLNFKGGSGPINVPGGAAEGLANFSGNAFTGLEVYSNSSVATPDLRVAFFPATHATFYYQATSDVSITLDYFYTYFIDTDLQDEKAESWLTFARISISSYPDDSFGTAGFTAEDSVGGIVKRASHGTSFSGNIEDSLSAILNYNAAYPYIKISLALGTCTDATPIFPVEPVSEPATMLLFGLGLVGLAGISRKKLKK
ncbi:MAG: PEP-CTERM sorting domain-containing protein [Candidatus Theseobacter exili]|nr:PEP-CTERM sorting domain-containing protein [Candidatus Theseobacter exili]